MPTIRLSGSRSILLAMLMGATGGCASQWKPETSTRPRTESIAIDHSTHGTQRRLQVRDGVWYQLSGTDLLAIDERGRVISTTSLASSGTVPNASDLVVTDGEIVVLLGDVEVVVLNRENPWRPVEMDRVSGTDLGFWPQGLEEWGDTVVTLGPGGARTLDGEVVVRTDGDPVKSIVATGGRVLHVSGRRIHRRAGGRYVGTASLLEAAEPHPSLPDGAMLFARNERAGALVGVLGEDCRELDPNRWSSAVPGEVVRLRQRGSRLLVVSTRGFGVYRLTGHGLLRESWTDVDGVQDADWLTMERLAVAGTFGRGIVDVGSADPLASAVHWTHAPAGLTSAASDGEMLIADSPHGRWAYRPGREPTQIDSDGTQLPPPAQTASVLGWTVTIGEDGAAELESPAGVQRLQPPGGGRFRCVASTEDAFWLGHDGGILLLMLSGTDDESATSRRLGVLVDGPVIAIEPLILGGGVAYASAHGGFGVVREIY